MTFSKIKALLAALMLAFTMSVTLSGCSSTEETEAPPADEPVGGGTSCIDECALVPEQDQDECLILCEA